MSKVQAQKVPTYIQTDIMECGYYSLALKQSELRYFEQINSLSDAQLRKLLAQKNPWKNREQCHAINACISERIQRGDYSLVSFLLSGKANEEFQSVCLNALDRNEPSIKTKNLLVALIRSTPDKYVRASALETLTKKYSTSP